MAEGNPYYQSYNGMLFDKELTSLLLVPEGMEGAAVLPDSLATVPAYVLSRRIKLSAMQGGTAQSALTFQDSIIYTKDKTILLAAPAGLGTTATIAPECTAIAEGAFAGNIWLKTIVVGGAVESIATSDGSSESGVPKGAFEQAAIEGATVVINAAGADYETAKAVWAAAGFQSFAEPPAPGASIEPIEGSGFAFTLLDDYTLSVRWQGDDPAPASLQIPLYGMIDDVRYKVSAIADGAFKGQPDIQRVEIPDSVRRIGAAAFEGASSLHTVDIPGSVSEIGSSAFKDCKSLIAAELNEGLATIGDAAFEATPQISWILPKSIKAVGDYAFANSPNLETVVALGTMAAIGTNALAGVTNCKVYAPYNENEAYNWRIGPAANANHFYPYGVKLGSGPIMVESGQQVNIFENGGYLRVPEGFQVDYAYKARPISVSDDGLIEAKEEGASTVSVAISLAVPRQVSPGVVNKSARLERAAYSFDSGDLDRVRKSEVVTTVVREASVPVVATPRATGLTVNVYINNPTGDGDTYRFRERCLATGSVYSEYFTTNSLIWLRWTDVSSLSISGTTITLQGVSSQSSSDRNRKYELTHAPYEMSVTGVPLQPMGYTTNENSNVLIGTPPSTGELKLYVAYNGVPVNYYGSNGSFIATKTTIIQPSGHIQYQPNTFQGPPSYSPPSGYQNRGWYTGRNGSGTSYGYGSASPFRKGPVSLYAYDVKVEVTIGWNSNGGSSVAAGTVNHGAALSTKWNPLPSPTKNGYTFDGWYTDNNFTTRVGPSTVVYANATYYAKWRANSYDVSFMANGGAGGQTDVVSATFDAAMPGISTTPPVRKGYTFKGWFDDADWTSGSAKQYYTAAGQSVRSWDKAEPSALYAGWIANRYKVEFFPMTQSDDPDAQAVDCETVEFTYDAPSTINARIESSKYTFVGWYVYGEPNVVYPSGTEAVFNLSEGDEAGYSHVSMFPVWAALNSKYTVHFDRNDSADAPAVGTMADIVDAQMGQGFALPAERFTRSGYTLLGFSTAQRPGDVNASNFYSVNHQGNIDPPPSADENGALSVTLYAVWSPQIRWTAPIANTIKLRVDPETNKLVGASKSEVDAKGDKGFRSWTSEKLYVSSVACNAVEGELGTESVFPDKGSWNHVYIKLRALDGGGYEESVQLGQTLPGYGLLKPYVPGSCFVIPAATRTDEPVLDADGNPTADPDGNPITAPITNPGTLDMRVGLETFDDVKVNIIGIGSSRGVAKLTYTVGIAYD